jgi:hypothetical protein
LYVAWVVPSDLVIVPSLPVTPDPAVAGPVTGGQIWAQAPVHFDTVAVSGANEYKMKPLALASTVAPPTCAVCSAPLAAAVPDPAEPDPAGLDAAGLDAGAGALVAAALPLEDELEHAAALSATAVAPAATSMVIRIRIDISSADSCLFR